MGKLKQNKSLELTEDKKGKKKPQFNKMKSSD